MIAVILGSGLGAAAQHLGAASMTYTPGYYGDERLFVDGHSGVVTRRGDVLVREGRHHLYEGLTAYEATTWIRDVYFQGCRTLILTNMVGAVDPDLPAGKPVLVSDHINLTGQTPLVGPQFIDLADAYSPRLRAIAKGLDPSLQEAVYAQLLGPTYETPAEVRWLRSMGVGLVGMSVAIETIQARALGMEVLAVSVPADTPGEELVTHEGVLDVATRAADDLGRLLAGVIHKISVTEYL